MTAATCINCGRNNVGSSRDPENNRTSYWLRVDREAGIGVCSLCRQAAAKWDQARDPTFIITESQLSLSCNNVGGTGDYVDVLIQRFFGGHS